MRSSAIVLVLLFLASVSSYQDKDELDESMYPKDGEEDNEGDEFDEGVVPKESESDISVDKDRADIAAKKEIKDPLFFSRRRRFTTGRRRGFLFGRRRSTTTTRRRRGFLFGRRRRRCSQALSRRRSGNCYVKYNGCGGQGSKFPIPYKKTFREACNKHDVCYYCGQAQGWSRSACDSRVLQDYKKICSCKYNGIISISRPVCRTTASAMVKAIRLFGKKYYEKTSPSWCQNPCVIQRGNPRLAL